MTPQNARAAFVTFGGVSLPITKWDVDSQRVLTDTTSSVNYDPTSDLVWSAQLPAAVHMAGTVEVILDIATYVSRFSADVFTSAGAVAMIFGIDATHTYCHGNFDISDFKSGATVGPQPDTIKATFSFKSNGVVTFGS